LVRNAGASSGPAASSASKRSASSFAASPMDLHLIDCATDEAWQLPALDPLFLGRRPDCDVVKDQPAVSNVHCSVARLKKNAEGPAIQVSDLGSTNGTFLNGLRLGQTEKITMRCGDVLTLAHQNGPGFKLGRLSHHTARAASPPTTQRPRALRKEKRLTQRRAVGQSTATFPDLAPTADTAGEAATPEAPSATRPRWRRLARPAECRRLALMEAGTLSTSTPDRHMVDKSTGDALPLAVGARLSFSSDGCRDLLVDSEQVCEEHFRIICRHGKRWRAQILRR